MGFRVGTLIMVLVLGSLGVAEAESGVIAVEANAEELFVRYRLPRDTAVNLIEQVPWTVDRNTSVVQSLKRGRKVTLPRFDGARDRLYSSFALQEEGSGKVLGAFQYVTDLSKLHSRKHFRYPEVASIKGLQVQMVDDAIALGAKHAALNINLPSLLDRGEAPLETWAVDGEDLGINMAYVQHMDRQIKPLTDAGMTVALILLNPVPTQDNSDNPMIHPRTDLAQAPFHLGAFNLTDRQGYRHYRAVIEFLAHRYSLPDAPHGWVQRFIVGNEVNSHWQWHNMGLVTPEEFMADYAHAVRMTDLAVRRYHPEARAYISLEHHFNIQYEKDGKSMPGVKVLDLMASHAEQGGDFPWTVAFHPYPENLFEPRFWQDKTATLGFDTPRITFKNLEVLPAYLAQEQFLYEGKVREITLSEQGFHTPDGEEGDLVQAAAYAYAYRKVEALKEHITSFILHRHVDHGREGGLRLGLWHRDEKGAHPAVPKTKKPSWQVFHDADTADWEDSFAFALPIIGIEDWSAAWPQEVSP